MFRISSRLAAAALALSLGAFAPLAHAEVTDFSNSGSSSVNGTPSYEATTRAIAGATPLNVSNSGSSAVGIGSPYVAERVMVTQNSVGASPTDFSGSGSSAVGGGFGTGPHVPQHSMLANR
ncbi:hypothetical protein MVG78_05990 [Roseomonas gilardii subsp. gilardii]|uniref:hypothetical protein n=1 Tax=Roseomonas gilardii TaxID=257708 RepID=UPI001FFA1F8E|nr:hypothetical protein [Roseomonas gilardii]UPG73697.1 hypothetical protein MVG78_05990 [Roseomonas gilardii subsp. gilardii]